MCGALADRARRSAGALRAVVKILRLMAALTKQVAERQGAVVLAMVS